ncbi:hypothetical protein [Sinorhizobium medicae]
MRPARGGGGRVTIKAGPFSTDGTIDVRGVDASGAAVARGGIVEITADGVMLGGEITASGASGGGVDVASRGVLSLAGRVEAQGLLGSGGQHPLSRAAGRGDGDGVDERIGSDPWGDDQRYGGPVDRHVGFLCGGRRLRQGGTHRHERAGRAPSVRGS